MGNKLLKHFILNTKRAFVLLVLSIFFVSCKNEESKVSSEVVEATYLCPMDCENSKSNKPGSCPVCKMLLVKEIEVEEMKSNNEHSKESVFKLDAVWTDQNNEKHQLLDYQGKLHLTTMIFTRCDYACPNLIVDLQNIEDALSPKAKNNLAYVLVTMDPENDTPAILNKYAAKFELNDDKWSFLTGKKDDIYQYSKLLGIGYKKFENGMYGHANIISLLNGSGEIVYQIEGIHSNRTELVKLINTLSNDI